MHNVLFSANAVNGCDIISITTQGQFDNLKTNFKKFTIIQIRLNRNKIQKAFDISKVYHNAIIEIHTDDISVVDRSYNTDGNTIYNYGVNNDISVKSGTLFVYSSGNVVTANNIAKVITRGLGNQIDVYGSNEVISKGSVINIRCGNNSDSCMIFAFDNTIIRTVYKYTNFTAKLYNTSTIHNNSGVCNIELYDYATAFLSVKPATLKKASTAHTVFVSYDKGVEGWLKRNQVKVTKGFVTIYKRVSVGFKTQENTQRETFWKVGSTVIIGTWDPYVQECGPGKFHGCAAPYLCDKYREKPSDRYIAIRVNVKDMYAWNGGAFTDKIAFRKGKVLYECDRFGKKV